MKWIFLPLVFLLHAAVYAQSLKGITGEKDTSFTNYSALKDAQKSFPQISLAPEIIDDTLTEIHNLPYCVLPGRRLELDKFELSAKADSSRPAIVIVHGGGWRSGDRSQHYPLAQRLALRGYVCFTPEYRLSTEELYPAAVQDIKAALRWIHLNASSFHIDTNRIAIVGFSAGGELAAFMGATNGMPSFEKINCNKGQSSQVKAVVDIDGILAFVHPESGEGNDSRYTSAASFWFGYSKKENPRLWEEASPLTQVGRHSPPTLFINSPLLSMHAGRDDYIKKLSSFGIYSEVQTFNNAPHAFCLFDPWIEPTVDYIDRFLKKIFQQ